MYFESDNQTHKDLEIFASLGHNLCVFDYLNFTQCIGGRNKLKEMLSKPLSESDVIRERIKLIHFFDSFDLSILQIDKSDLDFIEYYLKFESRPAEASSTYAAIEDFVIKKITGQKNAQYIIKRGVIFAIYTFDNLFRFIDSLNDLEIPALLQNMKNRVEVIKNKPEISQVFQNDFLKEDGAMEKISIVQTAQIDHMIRQTNFPDFRYLLDLIYELDAWFAVTTSKRKFGLCLPVLSSQSGMKISGLHHLFVKDAVCNDIEFSSENNTIFVSGPNMAGKSTLLKAISIAVYLAHCGFPVPAEYMSFFPLNGLYTSINLSDKLGLGESHFYAEVLRLKKIGLRLKEKGNMFIVFDELFRGTNVKDAYEGSLAIIKTFSGIQGSFFIVSTHIVELTKQLKGIDSIQFKYLETLNVDDKYYYSYKLKDGISEDRLGMYIIEQEGLIELLESCIDDKSKK